MRALADDTRIGIVRHLARESEPVASCNIVASCAERAALSQPAMSHHFKKLIEAGVLVNEKHGTENHYRLDQARCAEYGIDVARL